MNGELYRSPLVKHGRKKNGFRRFSSVTSLWDYRTSATNHYCFPP
jgi:hypothetical protein